MSGKFHNKYRIPSTRLQKWDYRWAGAYYITICTKNRKHCFGEIENKRMKFSSVGIIADIMWHEIKNHERNIKLDKFIVMPNHIHGILILDGNDMDHDHGNGGNIIIGGNTNNNDNNDDVHYHTVETLHATSLRSTSQPSPQSTSQPSTRSPHQPSPQSTSQPSTRSPHQPSPPSTPQTPLLSVGSLSQTQSISQSPSIPQSVKTEFMASIAPKSNSISTIIRSYKSAVTKHAHRLGFDFEWQTRFYDHVIRDVNDFIRIQTYIIENPEKWVGDSFYTH